MRPGLAPDVARRQLITRVLAAVSVLPFEQNAIADVPTYSLKGIPGFTALTGADAPRPTDQLGVLGRGKDGTKTGRLNFCDRKGCISSFSPPEDDNYVPPWTYKPDFSTGAQSSFSARKKSITQAAEGDGVPKGKSIESAIEELVSAIKAYPGATIIKNENRYIYAEFEDSVTGAIDDVEFLFSLDTPIVGYRSSPRKGGDDKRQRNRIRDLRKSLQPLGWKSVGRLMVD